MSEPSPWDPIAVPPADLNIRRVSAPTAVPCYWARDQQGACAFVVELHGDHSREFRKDRPRLNGVVVDLRMGQPGAQNLILTLEDQVNRDIFGSFCRTLAAALESASDSSTSLAVALAHIRRWKTFMAGQAGPRLTAEQIRGLFAELRFLSELLDSGGSHEAIVRAWMGPERSHQDFMYGDVAVEIKSLSGSERARVRISSEDQLESLQEHLFLRLYKVNELPEATESASLNEVIEAISRRLTDAVAVESFGMKLSNHGYVPLPDYDAPRLVVGSVRTFSVSDAFPRLVRSAIPVGISGVNYEIALESIAAFECDGSNVFRGL